METMRSRHGPTRPMGDSSHRNVAWRRATAEDDYGNLIIQGGAHGTPEVPRIRRGLDRFHPRRRAEGRKRGARAHGGGRLAHVRGDDARGDHATDSGDEGVGAAAPHGGYRLPEAPWRYLERQRRGAAGVARREVRRREPSTN